MRQHGIQCRVQTTSKDGTQAQTQSLLYRNWAEEQPERTSPISNLRERLLHSHSGARRIRVESPMGGPLLDLPLGAHCWESKANDCEEKHQDILLPRCPCPGYLSSGQFYAANVRLVTETSPVLQNFFLLPQQKMFEVFGVCLFSSLLRQWPVFMVTSHRRQLHKNPICPEVPPEIQKESSNKIKQRLSLRNFELCGNLTYHVFLTNQMLKL